MLVDDSTKFDASYDVVVIGFGGAGATAARFAADSGAKVLLVDRAPEGHEGGNTRYCGQIVENGNDLEQLRKYYDQMTSPLEIDEKVKDTFVTGMANMRKYFKEHLGVDAYSVREHADDKNVAPLLFMASEYPEFEGAETSDDLVVHSGIFDSALWKILYQNVLDRSDHIDVLYSAPARHLLQLFDKTVVGVQVEKDGTAFNVQARNGVVLTSGGFENNDMMIQDYLGETKLLPYGTLYNNGDGIKMAIEVGADLWHMNNYEPGGSVNFAGPRGSRARNIMGWRTLFSGSLITVGDDGSRYIDENDMTRHGHRYNHGIWRIPLAQNHPYMVFDEKKYHELKDSAEDDFQKGKVEEVIMADNVEELAAKISVKPEMLIKTIRKYNSFVEMDEDLQFDRDPHSMEKIDTDGKLYALAQQHTMLNTQGGPRRNEHAQILDPDHKVIPNLYGAGELGHVGANQYNGGGDIADCLIFGKIAGENAAKVKETHDGLTAASSQESPSSKQFPASDLKTEEFSVGPDQYIGSSSSGMGNAIVVRVTYKDNNIQDIEVLKESESPDYGEKAIKQLQQEIVAKNSLEVDAISGASTTSRAFKAAIKDALVSTQNTK